MDIENRLSEERSNAQYNEFLICLSLWTRWDSVENNTLLHFRLGNSLISGSTKKTVGSKRKYSSCALFFQNSSSLANSSSCINHIIYNNTIAISNITHKIHFVYSSSTSALLDNHGKSNILHLIFVSKTLLELLRTVDSASIRAYNYRVVQVLASKVVNSNNTSIEVINGNTGPEETLDLSTVQINSNNTVDSHGLKKACYIRGRNRDTSLHFTILSCVSIVRNDNCDPSCTCSVQGTDHEQQFHKIIVHGRTSRLNDIDILSSDILMNLNIHFSICKGSNCSLSKVDSKNLGNFKG
mmetsp:Transcript_680/g.1067  ORF Transcript_680/g.1067 Transcript_680/m.1067 type:complete len:297 (+) Transcript_680:156-1046(+)